MNERIVDRLRTRLDEIRAKGVVPTLRTRVEELVSQVREKIELTKEETESVGVRKKIKGI